MLLRVLLSVLILSLVQPASPRSAGDDPAGGDEPIDQVERGELVHSLGLTPLWKPHTSTMLAWDRRGDSDALGVEMDIDVYHDLMNPAAGVGFAGEGYVRLLEGRQPDAGLRLSLGIHYIVARPGIDYAIRDGDLDFVLSLMPPLRRGGLFGRGERFRLDWVPGREHSFSFGLTFPLNDPTMGKSRPVTDHARLPEPGRRSEPAFEPDAALRHALEHLRHAAAWIDRMTSPYVDADRDDFAAEAAEIRAHVATRDSLYPEGHGFKAEIAVFHAELERAFTLASQPADDRGSPAGDDGAHGRRLADRAREIVLDQVLIPYNRLLGQRKINDTVDGLNAEADRQFEAWLRQSPAVDHEALAATRYVFSALLEAIERGRQAACERWGDSRMVWLPMHYALRLEDHDGQHEIDTLLGRIVDEPFAPGNRADYVINELFQPELARMIRQTEDYHVLWIHDYKGHDAGGDPDEVSFYQTVHSYLTTLTDRVRAYDRTRHLPVFMIFLDEYFPASHGGREWMRCLENPLEADLELGADHEAWEAQFRTVQAELRAAVESSSALQAGRRRYGEEWLRNRVKVHVNMTHPADPSFTSRHFYRTIPFLPDHIMRDHRKLAFRDVTELDPGRGEALLTGVGIGEHYTGPTWEDRSLLVQGPALLELKNAARELLESHGLTGEEIPAVLRSFPRPDDYDAMVADLVDRGWNDPILMTRNVTGYGPKQTTVLKAALYDLVPAGTLLVIPDSVWNSPQWGAMLIGASLRGVHTFVISPSADNAPSAAPLLMSRVHRLLVRMLLSRDILGQAIAEAGGMLEVGIYDLDMDVADEIAKARLRRRNIESDDEIRRIFPFGDPVWRLVAGLEDSLIAAGFEPRYYTKDAVPRRPKLHLKTQFAVSQQVLSTLLPQPGWEGLIGNYVAARARQLTIRDRYIDVTELRDELSSDAVMLLEDWWEQLADVEREQVLFYFAIGSHNQNYRSALEDGEVMALLSGPAAMIAFLDIADLVVLSTWLDSVEELEAFIPEPGRLVGAVAHYLRKSM